jgi:epoxyqueuosine reductase QueG
VSPGERSKVKEEIRAQAARFVQQHAEERKTETRWGPPLVSFASAADPLFSRLREVVSPTHGMPADLLLGARTVVALFIPFERWVARSNIPGSAASREWAVAYIETNRLVAAVGACLAGLLEERGFAVALTPATHNFDEDRLVSDWSHRHVAYVAGLGTFGLNNMLITAAGCCGRLGSFVTSAPVEPDPRPAAEACLHKRGFPCRRCVTRCVNEALFVDRFDRFRCYSKCLENGRLFEHLGKADVCGKCVVGLPCSFTVPADPR